MNYCRKILNSNIASKNGEFQDVVDYISNMMGNEYLNTWFKVVNNFIGFSAAMKCFIFTDSRCK